MPIILLIRHAETDFNRQGRLPGRLPGIELNENGRGQAARLAEALAKAPLKAVYSSPLERTMATAAAIAGRHDLEVQPRPGLLELDVGRWQNRTLRSLRRIKLWRVVQSRPTLARFPEGETFAAAQERMVEELLALGRQAKPKDLIACVSHADPIKLALAYFLGLPLDLFQRLAIAPASLSTLFVSAGFVQVVNLNNTVGFGILPNR